MIVSIPVANLIQGVSQQPPQMRLASQASEQINAYSSPTDGLAKRPPTQFVGVLENAPTSGFYHFIDRDVSEKYILAFDGTTVKAWTMTGAAVPVYGQGTWGGALPTTWTSYMTGATADSTRVMSVADYTFVLNKAKTVAKSSATSTSRVDEALVTVTQGAYKSNYTISVTVTSTGGTTVSNTVSTWSGSGTAPAGELGDIKSDVIAENLKAKAWPSGINVTRYGSTLHFYGNTGVTFTIRTSDSGGDTLLLACKDTVPRLSDLPVQAPVGFVIAVNPDPEAAGTAYFVKYTAATSDQNGIWEETIAPGATYAFDKSTTPFVIKRLSHASNGVYLSIEEGPWANRTVGNDTTAKWPSFVGLQLQDVFFYKNRLGFLAGDKVCMSETGSYFNFFRTTVAQIIDSDPIDIGTVSTSVSTLRSAVPHSDRLLLFSDQAQFSLGTSNQEPLTSSSATSVLTTEFSSASAMCRPASTGKSVLFMQADSKYSGMRELYKMQASTEQYDAVDLSANANSYIEGTPSLLEVSSYDNLAVILTSKSRTTSGTAAAWNYKWLYNGNDKIQSAWSKWTFPSCTSIYTVFWINKRLYLVMQRGFGVTLEYMDFETRVPVATDFVPHLDCLVKAGTVTWNGQLTTVSTAVSSETANFVGLSPVLIANGKEVYVASTSSSSVSTNQNLTGMTCYVGIRYDMTYTFSPIYLRNQNTPVLDGRLSLTYGRITFSDTGFFSVAVIPTFRDSYAYLRDSKEYEYFGGGVDVAYYTDTVNLPTGTFRFPIHAKAEDVSVSVTSDSHYPVRMNSAVFEAHYVTRSRG